MEHEQAAILLVEDNLSDAELAIRALRRHQIHHSVLHLEDGEAAIDYLFARGLYEGRDISEQPKVIFLDLKMPKVGGLEVLRKVKAHVKTREVPVVIFTSSREEKDIKAGYAYGANSYIVKPVAFDEFLKVVGNIGAYWLELNQTPGKN